MKTTTDTQRRTSQTSAILAELLEGATINPRQALRRHGCFRLAARIGEIRQMGYQVATEMTRARDGARFATYWIDSSR